MRQVLRRIEISNHLWQVSTFADQYVDGEDYYAITHINITDGKPFLWCQTAHNGANRFPKECSKCRTVIPLIVQMIIKLDYARRKMKGE